MSGPLVLHGHSLLSKWGFGDGDVLWDWWYDRFDDPPPGDVDHHAVLVRLVETRLLPPIRDAGHAYEVEHVATTHNPIRLRALDGRRVEQLEPMVSTALDGFEVRIEPEEVLAAVRELQTDEEER